ncbi:MAG: rod shape-determining protein MreD, partial [Candidatus Bathyanammoxibius sp.]
MLWIIIVACALAISVLESTTFSQVGLSGVMPDLFLAFAVLAALNLDLPEAVIVAAVMGLSKDMLSQGPLGLNASLFIGATIIIGLLRHKLFTNNVLVQMLVVLIVSIIYRGGSAAVMWAYYDTLAPLPVILSIFGGAVCTAAIAAGPYYIFKKFRP